MKTFYAQICFCCFLALAALTGMADNTPIKPEGKGTKDSPYLISCIENLVWMQEQAETFTHEHFKMTADIDASETANWDSGRGFKPIGFANYRTVSDSEKRKSKKESDDAGKEYSALERHPFRGHFDGDGHAIKNLVINRSKDEFAALFGCVGYLTMEECPCGGPTNDVNRSSIRNLQVLDVDFKAARQVAGLVGVALNTDIEDCLVTGKLEGGTVVCGLAVILDNSCVSRCGIDIDFDNKKCELYGLTRFLYCSLIYDFFCDGKFRPPEDTNNGIVNGLLYQKTRFGIHNCLITMKLQGSKANVQGLRRGGGKQELLGMENCYFSKENLTDEKDTFYGRPNALLKKKATFTGWDFEKVWSIEEGVSFPTLRFPWLEKKSDSTLKKASGGLSKSTAKSGAKKQIRKAGTSTSAKKAPAKKSADSL